MAVNVPMTDSSDEKFPLPFNGETFLLTRDKICLSFRDQTVNVNEIRGRLFMTNMRMVFRVSEQDQTKARCETLEMPFRGLWDEKLNQPIFSSVNLSATMQYYDDQPFVGDLSIKLIFKNGGVGTFLEMFNNVLRTTRVQLNRERRMGAQPDPIPQSNSGASAPPPQEFMPNQNEAFIDPSDPSQIYTTQPVVPEARRRNEAPSWSVSGTGLRRR